MPSTRRRLAARARWAAPLRARAAQVVDSELVRLDSRLPGLDPAIREELASAVRRAVDKVLHAPTVRVKELAATPEGNSYASALRELFDLDPARPGSVTAVRRAEPMDALDDESRDEDVRDQYLRDQYVRDDDVRDEDLRDQAEVSGP